MQSIGIDIGSSTIKFVSLEDGRIRKWEVVDATSRPLAVAHALLAKYRGLPTTATGYGRNLLEIEEIPSVTEIKACAYGMRHLYPEARSVIDIGGQDVKVIQLASNGKVSRFEMNDRCAAGTGKFLEVMADKLGYGISEFGNAAQMGKAGTTISSVCAVFAESEVIGLLNRGALPENIARAVHQSVVGKIAGMYKRLPPTEGPIYLAGGGACNPCTQVLLEDSLRREVIVPGNPQIVVALGSAVLASRGR